MKNKISQLVLAGMVFCSGAMVMAQDAKSIEKDLNSELRSAQSSFFNGKFDESSASLQKATELLESLKTLDPAHKQLKSLEQKLTKQKADLEKKQAKGSAGKVGAGAPDKAKTAPAGSTKPKDLSRKVKQLIPEFDKTVSSLEKFEKGRMQRLQEGQDSERVDSILKEVQEKVDKLPVVWEGILAAANEEGAGDHPEILTIKEQYEKVHAWASKEIINTREKIAGAQAGQAAAGGDSAKLLAIFEENRTRFFEPIGNLSYEHASEKISEAFALFEQYSANKASLNALISEFEGKYGNSREQIEKATGDVEAGRTWESLKNAMTAVEEVPARLDAKVQENMKNELTELATRHDFFRLDKHAEIKKMEALRQKYVKGCTAFPDLEATLAADATAYAAKLDGKTWPAAKGSESDRQAALSYFQETWGKDPKYNYTVLGTQVTGDWSVQKKDITGKPIMYGLPVLLAVQKPEDKAQGLARVFKLTVMTAESADAKMTPPFTSDAVGDSHFIRAANIK